MSEVTQLKVRRALICGVSGQDGAYLASHLLAKGYEVFGSSRKTGSHVPNLNALGIEDKVHVVNMVLSSRESVESVIDALQPHEVYNLAGQSSVGLSFEKPVETMESIVVATANLLEAIRISGRPIRFFSAGSGEVFGELDGRLAKEEHPLRPRSPYGVAKAAAQMLVATYRSAYGMYACTGILFNHESPLRSERFATQKIVMGAAKISAGAIDRIELGQVDIARDWGWAPDYVDAMWRMLQGPEPRDYVIATGQPATLRQFLQLVLDWFALDSSHVVLNAPGLFRPTEIQFSAGDPSRIMKELGWASTTGLEGVVANLCRARGS